MSSVVALALASALAVGLGSGPASRAADAGGASGAALSVRSDPAGASVYVDGRFVGQTPLTVPALPAGDHRVRLVKDGYLENSRIIKVNGDKAAALQVRLTARGQAGQSAQSGLKIVVIAGEDAVNIIQQKTAVNPVVEVRDRNDLPVAGVPVTFTIGGQNAAFGGVQTLTVTTNAAGRAAVTSLNPLGSGAVQINVSAAYQGQTATATITQANFATAADAASAGKAAAQSGAGTSGTSVAGAGAATGAGAAAGGGGLSGLAIAAIAGGAGAGALVAAKAAGGGGGDDGGAAGPCTFSVSPASVTLSSAGGNLSIAVTYAPSDCEPKNWTATSNAPFILLNGAGTGQATINAFVEINQSGNPQRTGTITIAGQTVTVTQGARCAFAVSPSSLSFPGSGGTATVTVTASPAGCEQASWTASTISNRVTLSPTSGTGNGVVTVTVTPNPFMSGPPFTGNLSIAGLIVPFVQNPSGAAACVPQRVQGADLPEARTIQLGSPSGRLLFRYDNGANNPDRMLVTYEGRTLFDTGCAGTVGVRTQPLSYSGHSTTVTVQVTPNCRGGSGSTWSFELSCSP